jgi:hypothetical protein
MWLRQVEVIQDYLIEVKIHRTLHSHRMELIQLKMLQERTERKS